MKCRSSHRVTVGARKVCRGHYDYYVKFMRGFRGVGAGGSDPPEKSPKFKVSLQNWSRSPEKSQS